MNSVRDNLSSKQVEKLYDLKSKLPKYKNSTVTVKTYRGSGDNKFLVSTRKVRISRLSFAEEMEKIGVTKMRWYE